MQKVLWGILILVMLVSIPFLWERITVEEANDGYDIVLPYEDIQEWKSNGVDKGRILDELSKETGIHAVSFEPMSVNDLRNDYFLFDSLNARNFMRETGTSFEDLPEEDAYYLLLHRPEHAYVDELIKVLNIELESHEQEVTRIEVNDQSYLIVPGLSPSFLNIPVTFDMETIEEVMGYGLDVILRPDDRLNPTRDDHPLTRQIAELSASDQVNSILFDGNSVTGASDPEDISEMASRMNEWGLGVIVIEDSDQRGMHRLLNELHEKPLRLHSLTLGKGEEDDKRHEYRVARALKERNIQVVFVNVLDKNPNNPESYDFGEAEPSFTNTTEEFLAGIHENVNADAGEADTFTSYSQPLWFYLLTLIAASAFMGIVASVIHSKLVLPAIIIALLAFIIIGFSGIDIVQKLIVLGLAIIAPVYALFRIEKVQGWKGFAIEFAKTIGITLTGAWFVVVMLYGVDYSLHLDSFRGVRILAIAPAVLLTAFLIGYSWLKEPVKFWHLAVIAVVGAIVWFYLGRTGNQGIVIPYELEFRQFLEEIFNVRPRTTEFLIGIPAIVFSLYLMKRGFYHARYLLIIGALGMASMVGTFTHLHTPLLVSMQRTVLGVALGLVVGFLLILAWYLAERYLYPFIKRRFQL